MTFTRDIKDNNEKLRTYWKIGEILIAAQGGNSRAKYGNSLIKKWSKSFAERYGANYSERNLRNMRQFYVIYPKWNAVSSISWTHYRRLIKIKNENERNYYINQVIINNLSSRDLDKLIKSKAYDRLSYTDKNNIKLVESANTPLTIEDMIKDPILINVPTNTSINEKILHKYIIDMLEINF